MLPLGAAGADKAPGPAGCCMPGAKGIAGRARPTPEGAGGVPRTGGAASTCRGLCSGGAVSGIPARVEGRALMAFGATGRPPWNTELGTAVIAPGTA